MLDLVGGDGGDAEIEVDHQLGELAAVDEDDLGVDVRDVVLGVRRERAGRQEDAFLGPFGQGFDDLFKAPDNSLVIAEYKGGTAGFSKGQMGRQWVIRNIERLENVGHPMGRCSVRLLKTSG